ncbi:MAG: PEP-CTERM sorting domain-containing protein [Phycisphaerae bacterium]
MRSLSLLAAIMMALSAPALASVSYTITDLGTLTSVPYSNARTLNENGQVGGYSAGADHYSRAFFWEDGVMTDLGLFSAQASFAWDMNSSGQMAIRTVGPDSAWVWDNGSVTYISPLPGGSSNEAYGINDAGQVAGRSATSVGQRAFLWDDGSLWSLGTLGGNYSSAHDINNAGQVAGTSANASGVWHAFLWDDGVMTDLGTLGGPSSAGIAMNDAGHVVGRSWLPEGGPYRAFLYRDGAMANLGSLGGEFADALGINNLDQVVGHSLLAGGAQRAFIWDDGVMTDLNDLLVDGGAWELTEAADINDAGQIVGVGYINGDEHAFLLTPVPEPATLSLLSLGALALLRRRRA